MLRKGTEVEVIAGTFKGAKGEVQTSKPCPHDTTKMIFKLVDRPHWFYRDEIATTGKITPPGTQLMLF